MDEERRAGGDRRATTTVVLVDREPMLRSALTRTLSAAGCKVVGDADSGEAAIGLVVELRPDVVLTAIDLPGLSGVQTIEQITLLAPASHVLVLTHTERNQVIDAIVAGASGYILKTAPPREIVSAVKATAAGGSVLSSDIAGKLLERIRELQLPVTASGQLSASAIRATLTERELEIFALLASGQSNQEIGAGLSLSSNTVANHIKSILAKLQLENRIQGAVHAVRAGLA